MVLCKCDCGQEANWGDWVKGHWNKGKPKSKEHCDALSIANKGITSPLKGKLYLEIYGQDKALQIQLKQSIAKKGKHRTAETKQKIRIKIKNHHATNPNYGMGGKHHSAETRLKQSIVKKGKIFSKEHCKNIKLARIGTHQSEKTRQKRSDNAKNNPNYGMKNKQHSEKTIQKMRITQKIVMNLPKTILKLSNAAKRQHEDGKVKTRFVNTKPELKIKEFLQSQNIVFKYQKWVKDIEHSYVADFFVPPNIIIEADGNYWHNLPGAQEKDKIKTQEMQEKGYKVLRFWEKDIMNNFEVVQQKILNEVLK